jgi:hypothetical protein
MGMDYSVYVGCYIYYKNTEQERTVTKYGCSSCSITKSSSHKYCELCGNSLGEYKKTTKTKADIYGLVGESLFRPESPNDVLLPSEGFINLSGGDHGEFEITEEDSDIENFKVKYAEDIKALADADIGFEIRFGVVGYYQ